ncbi:hypothetical protein N7468_008073 [Penicillium chermesinum]|uniref:DNA-directed RNA polymerase III subunit n=1 Tax=Penicillium chermesinum TaxID=63820 RepID=A0A9W9NP30_9EURO|nr:uncharacterized protein N7468_008073 [Penicillium chermesinum]KAJ5223531.1 hypothetical protein N7468_008073 [Penicillium chermesinum]
MSRFRKKQGFPGQDMSWDTEGGGGGEADGAPTPLYPAYVVPFARKLSAQEQSEVDWGRHLRERLREGPFFSVLDVTSTSARKGTAARANFDPFNGMPSFSSRYQKKRRTVPLIDPNEREWVMRYFPRDSWSIIQPDFRPDAGGYKPQSSRAGKRGFEDDEEQAVESATKQRKEGEGEEDSGPEDEEAGELLDDEEQEEEEVVDDDFEDDEDDMGGDYNAEQYFDGGDEDFGDDDGGGGEEDTY